MRTRWSRDNRILAAIAVAVGLLLTGLYALVLRARDLTPTAVTNRVVLFVLFYIVVVLILALLFVLARNAVKLVIDSRRGVFGSRFRVRVVASHVGLALLPIALLLLPTTGLLQRTVETWFRPPVRETVHAGRQVADLVRQRAAALEVRVAERMAPRLVPTASDAEVLALLSAERESSGLDLVEWRRDGERAIAVSSPRWPVRDVNDPGPEWLADARTRGRSRRIEPAGDGGQVGRTLVALPKGILVLGTYDPPTEAAPLRALSRATSTYAGLEAERASLEAVQILFFLLLAFLVLLAAVWVGLLLARRVTRPMAALAASARRVGAGDFDAFVDVEAGDEIGALSNAFNVMTSELRTSREDLVAANADMAETNRRLSEERRRVQTILAHLGAGVLAFREDRTLILTNETARRLIGFAGEPERLDEALAAPEHEPLRSFLCRAVAAGGPPEVTLTLASSQGPLVLEARLARVPAQSGETASFVLTLEDTTALVKAERTAAWEEAARRMAHEIKNPLTPIRLAAERMRRRATSESAKDDLGAVVEEGASTIVEEVRTLSELVDAFGRFARLPPATLGDTDLGAVLAQVAKLYDGVKPGVTVTADAPTDLSPVKADAEQVKRALINLVDNAVAASPPGSLVALRASLSQGRARVEVTDNGPGIPPSDRARVFEPSYSTKPRGTGLGLAITARIAAEHAGRITVEENVPCGCRFVFEWPAA